MDIESNRQTDVEEDDYSTGGLKDSDFKPRIGFVRKVYGIVSVQLLTTVLLSWLAMATAQKGLGSFIISNPAVLYLMLAVNFITMIIVFCYRSVCAKVPTNYIVLSLFTLSEAYSVAAVCTTYQAAGQGQLVLMAAIMTAAMTFSLTLYAMTTKSDFTIYGGTLFIIACAIFLFGIFEAFSNNPTLHIVVSVASVVAYGFYLIYDTQLIIGGKRYELSLDDYIIGAVIIYIDIIVLFVRVLEILARLSNNSRN